MTFALKYWCGKCHNELVVVATAYGYRAPCRPCGIRWTWIRAVDDKPADVSWAAESL